MRLTSNLKIFDKLQPVPLMPWKPVSLEDWVIRVAKSPSYKRDPLWGVIGIGSGGRLSSRQIDKVVYSTHESRKKS